MANYRLSQKKDDQQQVTIKTLQSSLLRMEKQMAMMAEAMSKMMQNQDPNLRFNLSTTQATSLEDSLSDGDRSSSTQMLQKDDDDFSDFVDSVLGNSVRSPQKRESQLSMASAGTWCRNLPKAPLAKYLIVFRK